MIEHRASCFYWSKTLVLTVLGVMLVGVSASNLLPAMLVWNASPSVPTGLYWVARNTPSLGDLVLVQLPEWVRLVADQRQYLPSNTPAIKRIAALTGDRVCRFGREISVNEVDVATARSTDDQLRNMPSWRGCIVLDGNEVLLLADHPNSFDGRYFGVTKLTGITAVVRPIWIDRD